MNSIKHNHQTRHIFLSSDAGIVFIHMVTWPGPWKFTDSNTVWPSRKPSTVHTRHWSVLLSCSKGGRTWRLVISPERTGNCDVVWRLSVRLLCGPSVCCLPWWATGWADHGCATFMQWVRRKWCVGSRRADKPLCTHTRLLFITVSPDMKHLAQLCMTCTLIKISSELQSSALCIRCLLCFHIRVWYKISYIIRYFLQLNIPAAQNHCFNHIQPAPRYFLKLLRA